MLRYEYCCPDCGPFTILYDMDAEHLRVVSCPECGEASRRVFSVAGIHLRGAGWSRRTTNPWRTKEGRKPDYGVMEERAMENAETERKAGLRE